MRKSFDDLLTQVSEKNKKIQFERAYSLANLTTYGVGGDAALFARIETEDELLAIASSIGKHSLPLLMIGNGSNMLVSDQGFDGLVIQLGSSFSEIKISGNTVLAGGSAKLPVVARKSVAAGLRGFEWAVGVPGLIGGGVRMNAGGHGFEMADSIVGVKVLDFNIGKILTLDAKDLQFSYRESSILSSQLVLKVKISLIEGNQVDAENFLLEIVKWRRENQPGGQNSGSVFTNPEGDSAGRLIEASGLKGMRVGSASISEKHANFIQVDSGGSAEDVINVMRTVQKVVNQENGIKLEPETILVGFDSGLS